MTKEEKGALMFKALGDVTRMKIIASIINKEMNVTDIANHVQMSQSAVSHQLRYLKQTNIVKGIRFGKEIMYSLSDEHVKTIVEQVFVHANDCED